MPPLGADRPFVAPTVQTTKLPNGLELFVVERRDLPKVNVTLVTRAGGVGDPAGKAGVANLTMTAIDLGTKTRKALEIEQAFGDLGTTLTGGAGREGARLGLDVLSRNLSPALAILADVVQNPTFPEDEITRERKRVLDAIAQGDRSGNALYGRIQPMLAFGPEHPYGRPVQGLKGSVEGHHARRSGRVPPGAHQARLDGHRAGRRHLAGAGHGAGDQAFRRMERRGRRPHHDSAGAGAQGRPHLSGRSSRRRADGRGAVDSGPGARDARLRRAEPGGRGVGRRRLWHAAQPEPAREQGVLGTACHPTST